MCCSCRVSVVVVDIKVDNVECNKISGQGMGDGMFGYTRTHTRSTYTDGSIAL
jgi:hypothetical protein